MFTAGTIQTTIGLLLVLDENVLVVFPDSGCISFLALKLRDMVGIACVLCWTAI
jgi:hypothetical protein